VALVNTGLFGTKSTFVPLAGCGAAAPVVAPSRSWFEEVP
jgi:hypothetical protein